MAILIQAGNDMVHGDDDDRVDAQMWILGQDTCFMSFAWYCDQIGLSPIAMREGIVNNLQEGRAWSIYKVPQLRRQL